jgi:beta-lactamase class A
MKKVLILIFVFFLVAGKLAAKEDEYDIAYIWDKNLDLVLDYQQELETLFEPAQSRKLLIVGREDGAYGIVYDLNGDALSSAQEMVRQSEILRKADLSECFAVEDQGYFRLFNVSYGLGPNLDDLKKRYARIYSYLGQEVGKNLFIEKTDSDNYTLIYRRRGDRVSTYAVAKKHRKLLKQRKIYTSITPENNNPVIFGESSYLGDSGESDADSAAVAVTAPKPESEKDVEAVVQVVSKEPVARKIVYAGSSSAVERNIEEYIQTLRKKGTLSSDESTGWMVFDLTKGESVVDINADQVFQAASMIKPFVALAFFHQAKDGAFIYGPKSRSKMELMIQRSDNSATNWVMRVAGGPAKCEEILRRYYSHIFKDTKIVEYIPAGGKTYRNSSIPSDYVRFLQALWNDELPYGKEMRRLMSLPGRDRLYNGTPIPQGTLVYNKTGSTAHLCGDMGILVPRDRQGRRYPYALVGIIERSSRPSNYGNWMLTRGNVIRQVSTIVYEEMKRQYQLL